MAEKTLAHPELICLFNDWRIADLDYNDMAGSTDAAEFVDRARKAQQAFKVRRAELEAAGVNIWREE